MDISQPQKDLISFWQYLGMSTDDIVMISMCCQTEETARQMLEYMIELDDNNETITMQKLLQKVVDGKSFAFDGYYKGFTRI